MADWSALRGLLADVDESVTLAWDELDALVGGLPRSAYAQSAFWKGDRSGWPGFTTSSVKVGASVTFVRRTANNRTNPRDRGVQAVRTPNSAPDMVLVGCVKTKLDVRAPARDLYTSNLFRKERAYADAIRGLLSAQGATVIEPLAGLTMGARLAWYGSTAAPSSPDAPTPITDADVVELLDSLTRADEAITPAAFLADAGDRLRSPGLYSWWVDDEGAADLSRGLDHPVTHGLIYAGLAGPPAHAADGSL